MNLRSKKKGTEDMEFTTKKKKQWERYLVWDQTPQKEKNLELFFPQFYSNSPVRVTDRKVPTVNVKIHPALSEIRQQDEYAPLWTGGHSV